MSDLTSSEDYRLVDAQMTPHNRQAEEAVLGAVLANSENYFEVSQILHVEDFYIERHQWLWETILRLSDRREPLDLVTITGELDKTGRLADIGGPAFITALMHQAPSTVHAEAYARLIYEQSIRRRMLTAANTVAKLAHDQQNPVDNVIDEAEKAIFGVSQQRLQTGLEPIGSVLKDYSAYIDQLFRQGAELYGVPTGLIDLDRLLGGMQKSDLLIVAGRPGSGKTGFLLSVARNAAQKYKKHVAMFSLEMSNEQLVQRLIAQETNIDTQRLRTGKLDTDEWPLFFHAIDVLGDAPIWLDDTPAITPLQLRTKCRRLHLEHSLDLILVDYLQLMVGDTRNENRVQEVSNISRNLKVLARELNVPVLAAAQLSRAVEARPDKRPILSDLRESGSLEQDSDIVMFIHRPDALEKDPAKQALAEIIVAKHRNGPTHSGIEVIFQNNLARFENAATVGRR